MLLEIKLLLPHVGAVLAAGVVTAESVIPVPETSDGGVASALQMKLASLLIQKLC